MSRRKKPKTVPPHRWVPCHEWQADHPGEDLPVDTRETRWAQQQLFVAVEL